MSGPVILRLVPPYTLAALSRPRAWRDATAYVVALSIGAALTSVVLAYYGMAYGEQFRFTAALVLTNLLPGYLLGRMCSRREESSRDQPLRTFGAAFVLGLGPQLAGWAVAVWAGISVFIWAVPALISLASGCVVYRRPSDQQRGVRPLFRAMVSTPWWVSLTSLAMWIVLLRSLVVDVWSRTPLHGGGTWYEDLYWHVAISSDALHHVPPGDPQSAADGVLTYHWFSNAQAAALTLSSGVDLAKISVLAWFLPVGLAVFSLTCVLARTLSGSWAVANTALVFFLFPPALVPLKQLDGGGTSSWYWLSPSHMLAVPVGLLAVLVVIRLLRDIAGGVLHRASAAVVFYVFALCPGTKISLLPVLLAGLITACGALFFISRHAAAQRRRQATRLALVVLGGVTVLVGTLGLFGGGGGGSRLSYGASVGQLTMWQHGGGKAFSDPIVMTAMIVTILGAYIPYLLVTTLKHRAPLALWFFAGSMAAALGAMFFLEHPSRSQLYFVRGFIAPAAVFLAWGVVSIFRRRPRVASVSMGVTFLAGVLWNRTETFAATHPIQAQWVVPLAVLFAALAVVVVWLVGPTRRDAKPAVALSAGIVGVALCYSATPVLAEPMPSMVQHARHATPELITDEVNGARVLARANPEGLRIATNVHCLEIVTTEHCDARGFWVEAMTRSPALVGAWGYASSVRGLQGHDGYSYLRQSYPRPDTFAANEEFFAHPNARTAARLRALGVRFVYADARASRWSRQIAKVARPLWVSPTVGVFQLK